MSFYILLSYMAPRKDKQLATRPSGDVPAPASPSRELARDFDIAYTDLLLAKNELLQHPPGSRELKVALEDFGAKVVRLFAYRINFNADFRVDRVQWLFA